MELKSSMVGVSSCLFFFCFFSDFSGGLWLGWGGGRGGGGLGCSYLMIMRDKFCCFFFSCYSSLTIAYMGQKLKAKYSNITDGYICNFRCSCRFNLSCFQPQSTLFGLFKMSHHVYFD